MIVLYQTPIQNSEESRLTFARPHNDPFIIAVLMVGLLAQANANQLTFD